MTIAPVRQCAVAPPRLAVTNPPPPPGATAPAELVEGKITANSSPP